MPKKIPTPEGAVLHSFRRSKGMTELELAEKAGVTPQTIRHWESGRKIPSPSRLEEVLGAIGVPPEAIAEALLAHRLGNAPEEPGSFATPSGKEARLIHQAAAAAGGAAAEAVRSRLIREWRQRLAKDHRRWAEDLWTKIKKLPPRKQEMLVEVLLNERSWALAERISHASEAVAAHKADEALRLARLAVRIAEQLPGPESRRLHMRGYCTDFEANALRVAGNHKLAEEGFLRADKLWKEGEISDLTSLLDGTRRLDLKASLFMFRERTAEAIALLDKALSGEQNETTRARLLIKKAIASGIAGAFEVSLTVLEASMECVEGTSTQLLLSHRFETAVQLCNLDRPSEAERLLPQLHTLGGDNELVGVRIRWLEGRIWLALGRLEHAVAALSEAHRYFRAKQIDYDFAVVTIELAVAYLEQGKAGVVRNLAEEMLWIFQRQQIHQEALAALALFNHAARAQEAQLEWVKLLLKYLYRARYAASLRFEGEGPGAEGEGRHNARPSGLF